MAYVLRVVRRPKTDVLPLAFTGVLQREGRLTLATAKAKLDAFAEHGEVLIELEDEPTRDAVASELRLLGAQCTPEPTVYAPKPATQGGPRDAAVDESTVDPARDEESTGLPLTLSPAMTSSAAWKKAAALALVLSSMLVAGALRSASEPSNEELRATIERLHLEGRAGEGAYRGISPAQKAANARLAAQAENLRRLHDGGEAGKDAGAEADDESGLTGAEP
jgi:hypothetical protein